MSKVQTPTNVKNRVEDMITVGAFSPVVRIGNAMENAYTIVDKINSHWKLVECDLVVTPELSLTGYTCQDMFFNRQLLDDACRAIEYIKKYIRLGVVVSVGAPLVVDNKVFNCSVLIKSGAIISITPKKFLANYAEFYEDRWFTSYDPEKHGYIEQLGHWVTNIDLVKVGGPDFTETISQFSVASEICEDLWAADPVSTHLALAGAEIIINNSASNETIGKAEFRRNLVKTQSARTISVYIYCSAGLTESSQDVVFGGHNIIAENGRILAESDLFDIEDCGITVATVDLGVVRHDRMLNKTFSSNSQPRITIKHNKESVLCAKKHYAVSEGGFKYFRDVSMTPFVPSSKSHLEERCKEIFDIQVAGLVSRLICRGNSKIVIGVSGGLDSTLALLVAYAAIKKLGGSPQNIVGVTMPCFGTTSRTKSNAIKLMEVIGCQQMEVNISDAVRQHLKDIDVSEDDRTVTFENAQARERTQVLMDIGNKVGGFVLGTGDMSELALGWCTYNADQMSMYNSNGSIPKTLVKTIVKSMGHMLIDNEHVEVIDDIVDTPVSPELLPPTADGSIAQLTENSIGPYIFNDFFMYYHVRYGFSKKKIIDLARIGCEQSGLDFDNAVYWLNKFYQRFHGAQFKRNPMPDGVKVGSVSLNPRGDWRCPTEFDSSIFK